MLSLSRVAILIIVCCCCCAGLVVTDVTNNVSAFLTADSFSFFFVAVAAVGIFGCFVLFRLYAMTYKNTSQ